MRDMITMITVSDMDRSVRFYRDILGLKLRFQSPDWSEFDTGGTTLALHGGGKAASVPQGREQIAGTASIGFNVDDLEKVYEPNACQRCDSRFSSVITTPSYVREYPSGFVNRKRRSLVALVSTNTGTLRPSTSVRTSARY